MIKPGDLLKYNVTANLRDDKHDIIRHGECCIMHGDVVLVISSYYEPNLCCDFLVGVHNGALIRALVWKSCEVLT